MNITIKKNETPALPTVGSQRLTSPIFSRHETFHPRYGWLKKGFDKASQKPDIFNSDNAAVSLGVGKNMVKAIRYWCNAFKVLEEDKGIKGQGYHYVPSPFGSQLIGEEGWDPYQEDIASLWLLHWNLLKPPCYATAWYYAFNVFNKSIFTATDLLIGIKEYNAKVFLTNKISESSLVKDINCILRMYVEQASKKGFREESIDSPFAELNLIKGYGDAKHFVFNMGKKLGLAPEIIVATCLEYASTMESGAKTISLSRLLYDQGSPGTVFKLTGNVLHEAIEFVASSHRNIAISEAAGLVQLSFSGDPSHIAQEILDKFYTGRMN